MFTIFSELEARTQLMSTSRRGPPAAVAAAFSSPRRAKTVLLDFSAVPFKVLHMLRDKARAKSEKTGAELLVDRGPIQRDGFEVQQGQSNPLVPELHTDANKSLIAVIARSKASGAGSDTRCLTGFYFLEQPVLLNVADELGDDDVAGAWQGAVLDIKTAAAAGDDHGFKIKEELSGKRRHAEHPRDDNHLLVCHRGAVFPRPQLHTGGFGKACPVDLRVFEGFAQCAAMEAIEEVDRRHELAVQY